MTALAKSARSQLASKAEAQKLDAAFNEQLRAEERGWIRIWIMDLKCQETQAWQALGFANISKWRDAKIEAGICSHGTLYDAIDKGQTLEKSGPPKMFANLSHRAANEIVRLARDGVSASKIQRLAKESEGMPPREFAAKCRALTPKLDSQIEWRNLVRRMHEPPYKAWNLAEATIRRARELNPDGEDWSEVYEAAAEVIAYVGAERIRELLDNGRIAGFPPAGEALEMESKA